MVEGDWLAEVAIEVVNENPFSLMTTLRKHCVIPLRFLIGSDSAAGGSIEKRGMRTASCTGPFITLCPGWQQMAYGTDGFFSPSSPWVLNSTATNFAANHVTPNQVVWLSQSKSQYPGTGVLLAIEGGLYAQARADQGRARPGPRPRSSPLGSVR
jgi:hypothetical protein